MEPRRFLLIFFAVSAILAIASFIVPFLSPYGSFVNLDGTPGVIDHWDIWSSKDPFTMVMYLLGDIFCHQEMDRTVILNGSEMPMCIRDLGLLTGFMFGCTRNFLEPFAVLCGKGRVQSGMPRQGVEL